MGGKFTPQLEKNVLCAPEVDENDPDNFFMWTNFIRIYCCDLKKIQVWWSRWDVEVIYEIFVVICIIYIILTLKNSRSGGVGGRWRQGAEVGQPLQTTAPLHFMFCRIIYTWCIFIHLVCSVFLVYNIHLVYDIHLVYNIYLVYNIHLLFLFTS